MVDCTYKLVLYLKRKEARRTITKPLKKYKWNIVFPHLPPATKVTFIIRYAAV